MNIKARLMKGVLEIALEISIVLIQVAIVNLQKSRKLWVK